VRLNWLVIDIAGHSSIDSNRVK